MINATRRVEPGSSSRQTASSAGGLQGRMEGIGRKEGRAGRAGGLVDRRDRKRIGMPSQRKRGVADSSILSDNAAGPEII